MLIASFHTKIKDLIAFSAIALQYFGEKTQRLALILVEFSHQQPQKYTDCDYAPNRVPKGILDNVLQNQKMSYPTFTFQLGAPWDAHLMSRSIPALTIPRDTPPGICTEKIPGPRAFDSQFFPVPGAFDNPRDI